MKAALCYELGKPLVVEDGVTVDSPGPGEVKVKVVATAVCRSDLHYIEGTIASQLPGLPGHETAGYVEEVGEGVTRVKPGDPVCVTAASVGCGMCTNCISGLRSMCLNTVRSEPRHYTKKGEPIFKMASPVGGFAEYTTVHEYQLVKIPEDMPIDRAALLSCAVISGFGSVLTAGIKLFSSVAVLGTGAVGLNVIQGAVFCGACPVIAVDILDNRLEEARNFGATYTINSTKVEDPIKAVQDLTDGMGADYVFISVTTSSPDILRQAIEMSSRRSVIVRIAPGGRPSDDIGWARPLIQFGTQRMVIGTAMGSSNIIVDIPRYVALYKVGRLKLDELITARYPLDRINEAIESLKSGEALRNVITF